MNGHIKTINERGFGFIRGEDGIDVFFHRSAVEGEFYDLEEGASVEFFPVEPPPPKGARAAKVRLIEATTPAA